MATIARLVTVLEAQMKGFDEVSTAFSRVEKGLATFSQASRPMDAMTRGMSSVGKAAYESAVASDRMIAGMSSVGKAADTAAVPMSFLQKSIVGFIGSISVGAIAKFALEISTFASDMNDLSAQTGITTERLQALNYVGAAAGVTVEDIATGVAQLSKRLVGGDDGAVSALRKLHLNAQALVNMAPDEAFIEIAEAVAKIPNPMERSALMMELFGRNGSKFLRLATTELEALIDAAEKSKNIIPKETLDRADQFDDKLHQIVISAKAITASLTGEIIKAFSTVDMGDTGGGMRSAADVARQAAAAQAEANKSFADTMSLMKTAPPLLQTYGASLTDVVARLQRQKEAQDAAAKATAELNRQYAALMSEVRNAEGLAKMNSDFAIWNASISEATKNLQALAMTMQVTLTNQSTLTEGLMVGAQAIESQNAFIGTNIDQQIQAQSESMAWRQAMDDLASSFFVFAQIAGDSMGTVLRQIGAAIAGIRLADDGVNALKKGFSALGSGNILQGLTGIVGGIGGIVSAASAAVQVITSLWHGLQRLFGGGEEGVVVNPARDKFFQQFVDRYGMSPFESMAQAFADAGISGDVAERMIRNLYDAETMAQFRPAAQSIIDAVGSLGFGMNFHKGGMVPGTGEVNATLLGGERVQSREEVMDMRVLVQEVRELPMRIARSVIDAQTAAPRPRMA